MASRRSKASAKGAKGGESRKSKKKEPRQKKAKVRTIEEGAEDEAPAGLSVEGGIVYTTTFLLIGAIVLAFMALSAFPAVN